MRWGYSKEKVPEDHEAPSPYYTREELETDITKLVGAVSYLSYVESEAIREGVRRVRESRSPFMDIAIVSLNGPDPRLSYEDAIYWRLVSSVIEGPCTYPDLSDKA